MSSFAVPGGDCSGCSVGTLLDGENRILEMIATGASLEDILTALAHLIESQSEGLVCSFLLLNAGRLWHGAAPSLPEAYIRAMNGIPIGPNNGSCGTAAYRREPIIVSDLLEDPLWEDYRHLAIPHGLRACWSTPYFSFQGDLLGTFAMYSKTPRSPGSEENQLIGVATRIATIAVERWSSDAKLRYAAESYRSLVENLNDVVFSLDVEGNLTYISSSVERLSGYQTKELVGQPFSRFLHPADLELVQKNLAEVLAGNLTPCEFRVLDKHSEVRWCRSSSRPQILQEQLAGLTGVMVDITEQKRSQLALREAEQKYRTIFEEAVVGIFQSTPEGRYITANPALLRMLGYSSLQELAASVTDVFPQLYVDPQRQQDLILLMKKDGRVQNFEVEMYRRNGGKIWFSINARAIYQGSRVVAYEGMCEDITDHKILEQQFLQAQRMEAVGQLAGGVAHDFNNLLGVILGQGELLLQSLRSPDPWRRRIEQICQAAQRAVSLTAQLLAFSRRQRLNPSVLDLNAVLTNVSEMIQRLIGEHIRIVAKLDPALDPVKADASQIEQVLLNLVVNARDAMPAGGTLTIETSNIIIDETGRRDAGVKEGSYVLLAVTDTGMGMDEETLSRIFEPFFTTKELGKGTGLGLATVYGIVKQSDGYISVSSQPGKGTTFRVFLPPTEEAMETDSRADAPALSARGGEETILLVEDAGPLREVTREFLEDSGYHVLEANSGDSALSVADSYKAPISAVITDVVMPGMNGVTLAEQLRSVRPQTKVLYVSGYADDALFRHGILPSRKDFLRKPYTQNQLTSRLRELLTAGPQTEAAGSSANPAAPTPHDGSGALGAAY